VRQQNRAKTQQSCGLRDVKLARGHTFVCSPSLGGTTIIDAGAHRCEFASIMATTYGARVIALEPNPALSVEHHHPDITLVRAALSNEDGVGSFCLDENPEGGAIVCKNNRHLEGREVVPVRLRNLCSLVAEFEVDQIGLLKLDIEGAEFGVLHSIDADLSRKIRQITVEFHPTNPRGEVISRMERAFAHLVALGFYICRSSYGGYGDVLFLNSNCFENPSRMFRFLLPYYRKGLERGFFKF
jgi:FkbM family methyltransferase